MKIAICDDEKSCLAEIEGLAEEYSREHRTQFELFSHPDDLMEKTQKIGGFDIYILDIVMPGTNGIELGKKLREEGYDGKIIYLTSSEEYSLDAFKVKAFDYIIKPINKANFFNTVNEAAEAIAKRKDKKLIVKTKEKSVSLSFDKIIYAEFTDRAVCYHMQDGSDIVSVTIRTNFSQAVKELLCDRRFVLCSQSMLVNLDYLTEIGSDSVSFGNIYRTHLGEKNCRKLRGIWSEYLFSEEV
ncbi:MAG: response regulator transcription factor [Clostridia bacterium]|nr:response regulator transcription factor [Clostridia bacterium]